MINRPFIEQADNPIIKEKIGPYDHFYLKKGPKHTQDPFYLVDFLLESPNLRNKYTGKKKKSIMDIGTGSGVILLLIAQRLVSEPFTLCGVELNPCLAKIAEKNVNINGLGKDCTIINKDFRLLPEIVKGSSIDIIISNPPYIKKDDGRISPNHARATARSDLYGNVAELISSANYLLRENGLLFLIFPVLRRGELLGLIKENQLHVLREQSVYTNKKTDKARLFMIEAVCLRSRC